MGQILSAPITEKHTSSRGDGTIEFAASEMQGWRVTMEDAHTTEIDFCNRPGFHFFAVYDGHGGQSIARYAGANTYKLISAQPAFDAGDYAGAMRAGFHETDRALLADPAYRFDMSGCTAIAVLITKDRVVTANAGDSRALISTKGVAKPLSFDHKPSNPEEARRIQNAGGFVQFGRVNGNLALSRAIGDFDFKKNASLKAEEQMVTVDPEITEHVLTSDDEFIVLACDGIWDCMTNQEVVDFVRPRIAAGDTLASIAEALLDRCLAKECDTLGIGCDNMTVIIVGLYNGEGEEGFRQRCARPADPVPPSALVRAADSDSDEADMDQRVTATVSVSSSSYSSSSITISNLPANRNPDFVKAVLASLEEASHREDITVITDADEMDDDEGGEDEAGSAAQENTSE